MSTQKLFPLILLLSLSVCVSSRAVDTGSPVEIASKAKDTRNQTWASIAWGEEAQCWLVAWREGYLNEKESQIWCARISPAGKTLDPAGILLTSAEGLKDIPKVASDGKDFLILWDDFRNKKDWDIYAKRISGKGEVLGKEATLIAGGAHNQCRPAVAFSKGHYAVMWMGFKQGIYGVYGTRIAPDGKVVGPTQVISEYVKLYENLSKRKLSVARKKQATYPVIAANQEGHLLSSFFVSSGYANVQYLARQVIDSETGGPKGEQSAPPKSLRSKNMPGVSGWYRERCPAIALGAEKAMLVSAGFARKKSTQDLSACLLSKSGDVIKLQELGTKLTTQNKFKPLHPRPATAFDGKAFLAIGDGMKLVGGTERKNPKYSVRLIGWRIATDGSVENADGFLASGNGKFDCLLPALAAGPKGSCLLVYSEVRGVDDVKILARVIK